MKLPHLVKQHEKQHLLISARFLKYENVPTIPAEKQIIPAPILTTQKV